MQRRNLAREALNAAVNWAVLGVMVTATFSGSIGFGQQRGPTTGGTSSVGAGRTTGTSPLPNTNTYPGSDPSINNQHPIFISGKVALNDGSAPSEPIKIERICSNTVRLEGYTDRKGRFSFEIGRNQEFQDASETSNGPFSDTGGIRGNTMGNRSQINSSLMGCDLRANLPGFRSDMIPLSNVHYLDNPDVGTIVLHRLAKVDGLTISATSALAPKDARKAFEKAEEAIKRKNPDEAQKNLERAVELYPRYAAAWFNLGLIQEQRDHKAEARKSYEQALAADSKYIPPHERLAWIALGEKNWEDLAKESDQVIQLDPIDYPDAFYLNGVANLELKKFTVAEKQLREAIRLDPTRKNMRSYYFLGLALAQEQQFQASAESMRTFLSAMPEGSDGDVVRKQLAQIEDAARVQSQQSEPRESAAPGSASDTHEHKDSPNPEAH